MATRFTFSPMHRSATASAKAVAAFASQWPCANFPAGRSVTFSFDGAAESALAQDALVALALACPVLFTPLGRLTAQNATRLSLDSK